MATNRRSGQAVNLEANKKLPEEFIFTKVIRESELEVYLFKPAEDISPLISEVRITHASIVSLKTKETNPWGKYTRGFEVLPKSKTYNTFSLDRYGKIYPKLRFESRPCQSVKIVIGLLSRYLHTSLSVQSIR